MGDVRGENRRSEERVEVDAFVKVSGKDKEFVSRTRDLSRNGPFLYTRVGHMDPFKVGSTVKLELYDYDHFVNCKVVVVRVVEAGSAESERYPTGFGVRIIEIGDSDRETLTGVIDRVRDSGSVI